MKQVRGALTTIRVDEYNVLYPRYEEEKFDVKRYVC